KIMTAIDEIKARLDIVDIVSESVDLKRSGKSYSGFCPFHHNTRTPAFAVFPDTGTWRCFGECNEGGDIFSFVMKKEGWDFKTTLQELAQQAGVQLRPLTAKEEEKYEEFDRLRDLLELAVTFYRHQLLHTPAGNKALEYLHERGLSDQIIESFGLGYAPDSWEAASNHFKTKGYSQEDLINAGMVSERDSGGTYDRFRHRVVLPIRDQRSRMTGFGARTLDPDGIPKYLNSPKTDIFDKGQILFGLDKARKAIRSKDQVVIVEGYMGVLAPHQHGYANVVATMGTALTDDHLRLIKRFSRRIVLAMDSDAAGVKATLRGLQVARETLDREDEIRFDARGLLRHEGRLKADIRVSTLPPGMDPDDVINHDPAAWEEIIAAAKPIVVHVMETLAEDRDLEDAKIKTEIANQVMPLIADIPSAIERDTYRQRLARLLRVDERTLLGANKPSRSPRRRYPHRGSAPVQPPGEKAPSPIGAIHAREIHLLGILLRRPDLIYRIDRQLQEDGLNPIGNKDFQQSDHLVLFRLVQDSLKQDTSEPLHFALNHLSEAMMPLTDIILKNTEKIDPDKPAVLEDSLRVLLSLRITGLSQQLDHLRYLQETSQEKGDLKAAEYQNTLAQYIIMLGRLHQARNRYTNHSATK
ncbi:MAG: DNA primase, partial [Chloroflexota bacterium]|nr:DNA primase [Chloroflexota bacterium]